MRNVPRISRAMLSYGLWVAIEDTLRNWLSRRLIELFGSKWIDQFPVGVWNKLAERYGQNPKDGDISVLRDFLEQSDFPDLFDIVRYKKKAREFVAPEQINEIEYYCEKLYALRNMIAHKPNSFSVRNLDDLAGCADWVITLVGSDGLGLSTVLKGIESNPELYAKEIPAEFIENAKKTTSFKVMNNLPVMDYEFDGGFVGRRDERQDLKRKLINKRANPIITISGAGGVGKTALAHIVCEDIATSHADAFQAVIWISAKKDRLTLTGIEDIEPTAQSFEQVLDAILLTFGFTDYLQKPFEEKRAFVQSVILDDPKDSILLVIDNLETILHDENLIEFLKDILLPHKVLITSRLGLGEVERRVPLKEMTDNDAIELFRRIAVEKSAKGLAQQSNEIIKNYVQRMNSYPLVIKWVVGQAALGKDIERLVQSINTTDNDISKFCFEYIFDKLLTDNSKLVLRILANSEQELTQSVLMHISDLGVQDFEDVMLQLELASLVIPSQLSDPNGTGRIITKYGILPLTRTYILSSEGQSRDIKAKLQGVQNLAEDARRAKRLYELSLEYLGAETPDELVASKHIQTAFARHQAEDYNGAIDAIKRAEEITPNFFAVYRSWAVIEGYNGNYEKAIELFERASILQPNDPITWFYWGNLEKNIADYDNARKHLSKAFELVENKASVLVAIGNVEKQDSNFSLAIEKISEAIDLIKENASGVTNRDLIVAYTSLADTYYRWAEIYELDNQLDSAIEKVAIGNDIMQQVIELGSTDAKTRETQMKGLLLLGRFHLKKGNKDIARMFLEEMVDIKGMPRLLTKEQRRSVVRGCYLLTPLLLDEKQPDRARQVYNLGLSSIDPTDRYVVKYERLASLLEEKPRLAGVFTVVVADRGFGFIKPYGKGSETIFAHISEILDEIGDDLAVMKGVHVSFSVEETDRGLVAKAIRILR